MYRTILVPVDLAHVERLDKALSTAADLARHYDATVTYVGVTEETPGPVARTPAAFGQRLDAFARDQASAHGIRATAHAIVATDPAAQINKRMLQAVHDLKADLVVMASHPPAVLDWILPSHGGYLAEHAPASVFVVRDAP